MSATSAKQTYRELVEANQPPDAPPPDPEQDLDSLILIYQERERLAREKEALAREGRVDPIQRLRDQMRGEFVLVAQQLREKYAPHGLTLELDVEAFLAGGRELRFIFGFKDIRLELHGVVTQDAIAFQVLRCIADTPAEMGSGPSLRLRHLDADAFKHFICERLTLLMRAAMRMRHPA